MAKGLLWVVFIIHFLGSLLVYQTGSETPLKTTVIALSILGVLAICESIESLSEKGEEK